MLRDVFGRAADLGQIALGHALLRPYFKSAERARSRHEPHAARGDAFVRAATALEKAAFVGKMLGSDGGWTTSSSAPSPKSECCAEEEILFAGDLLFPGAVDESSLSKQLRARIARAAKFVVNLEGTVGERANDIAPLLTARGFGQLIAYAKDPNVADWVSRFDEASLRTLLPNERVILSVANNHTLDDGEDGFARTVAKAKALGCDVIGDARKDDGAVLVDVGSARVALFALTYGSNRSSSERCHLGFDRVPYALSRKRMEAIVERLRARGATHVVALLHWGYEHEHEPAPEQRVCRDVLFDAGVSAIVGHHPHLVQPSEGAAGRWVSYSLGDFVGGDRTIWSRFAALVALRFLPEGKVSGEVVPVVQTPFWQRQRTMLLSEAPSLEQRVFARYFAARLERSA